MIVENQRRNFNSSLLYVSRLYDYDYDYDYLN